MALKCPIYFGYNFSTYTFWPEHSQQNDHLTKSWTFVFKLIFAPIDAAYSGDSNGIKIFKNEALYDTLREKQVAQN